MDTSPKKVRNRTTRATLIEKIKNPENTEAWARFDAKYRPLLINYATKRELTEADAQEVAQETLLAVYKGIKNFTYDPARASFKSWLLTIFRRKIIDQARYQDRQVLIGHRKDGDTRKTGTAEREPDPESKFDTMWDEELLQKALHLVKQRVSDAQYQIYHLHVIKEWEVKEVAKTLGISEDQVYKAKHRVNPKMIEALAALTD